MIILNLIVDKDQWLENYKNKLQSCIVGVILVQVIFEGVDWSIQLMT
jgi:hypothetical protein